MRLRNKKILITGATSGIGFTSLQHCIEEGTFVIFTARNVQNLERIQQLYLHQSLGLLHGSADILQHQTLVGILKQR